MRLEHTEDISPGESKLVCHGGCCCHGKQPYLYCSPLLKHSCEAMASPEGPWGPLKSKNLLFPWKDHLTDKRPRILMSKLGRMGKKCTKIHSVDNNPEIRNNDFFPFSLSFNFPGRWLYQFF